MSGGNGPSVAPREVAARAIWEAGAWAGDCCDHTDYDACTDCQRVCLAYADAALCSRQEDCRPYVCQFEDEADAPPADDRSGGAA